MAPRFAFVTLLTSDHYLPGVLTAIHSLLDVEGSVSANDFDTVCLVTPATVSVESIKALRKVFTLVVGVETIESRSHKELNLLGRPDLVATLTKLHLFRLTQYRKVIYLDADTLVLRPLSHLFSTQNTFSAAPDIGWPDCFNSGFMVATPSNDTFEELTSMASQRGSWDGGDQGLLNDYFEDNWNRLSFTYNVTPSSLYQYEPAIRRYGQGISVVHFIGRTKPWDRLNRSRPDPTPSSKETKNDYNGLLHRWYDVYEKHYGQLSTAAVTAAFGSQQLQASNFVIPRYSAAWEEKGKNVEYRPPSPEELKTMFEGKLDGNYTHLPWEGREAFEAQNKSPSPPPVSEQSSHPEITFSAPSPPLEESSIYPPQKRDSPPIFPWDPATQEPNRVHMQMREPLDQHYSNVWDERPKREEFFEPPKYQDIPSAIQSHYEAVTRQKSREAKPIFPWEGSQQPKATRVFPTETTSIVPQPIAAPAPISPPPQDHPAPAPVAAVQQQRGLPLDFSYSNAWDSIKGIKDYAKQLSKPKTKESWRVSTPNTTRSDSTISQRSSSSDRLENDRASGKAETGDEGDDEETEEDTEEDDEEDKAPIRYKSKPVSPPVSARSARPASLRPSLQRDMSVGSASRVPTVASLVQEGSSSKHKKTSSLLSQISPLPSPSAYATRFGSPSHSAQSSISTLPVQPAQRVFDPATGIDSLKKEGLAALQRFVKSMEQNGSDTLAQQKQYSPSQEPGSART